MSAARRTQALLGLLVALVLVSVPWLGVDAWPFAAPAAEGGPLGWLTAIADGQWDLGLVRAPALLAGVVVAVAAIALPARAPWPRVAAIAGTALVVLALLVPATLLQVGLRDGTEPWFHVNDASYQVELAGQRILDGQDPYGAS